MTADEAGRNIAHMRAAADLLEAALQRPGALEMAERAVMALLKNVELKPEDKQ